MRGVRNTIWMTWIKIDILYKKNQWNSRSLDSTDVVCSCVCVTVCRSFMMIVDANYVFQLVLTTGQWNGSIFFYAYIFPIDSANEVCLAIDFLDTIVWNCKLEENMNLNDIKWRWHITAFRLTYSIKHVNELAVKLLVKSHRIDLFQGVCSFYLWSHDQRCVFASTNRIPKWTR